MRTVVVSSKFVAVLAELWILLCGLEASSPTEYAGCTGSEPLGLISGEIEDWQISASSVYPAEWEEGCDAHHARVYQPDGLAWCAKYKSTSEWLQINVGVPAKVNGIMIQGRGDGREWVTSFRVSYSMDTFTWEYVANSYGDSREFEGNEDSYKVRHHYFDTPVIMRHIRFHPVKWHRHPSMRVEIYGCQTCKTVLSEVPYVKIRASSERMDKEGVTCWAEDGHVGTHGGWCANHNNDKQWIEIDVGPPTYVMGIVTKGRGSKARQWVTHFRLSYSNDGRLWNFYQGTTQEIQRYGIYKKPSRQNTFGLESDSALEFVANHDRESAQRHYLQEPFVARFVRFHPTKWHNHISMRVGVIGCPHLGECPFGFMKVNSATVCIENMAYQRDSWLLKEARSPKRHVRNSLTQSRAARVVDGLVGSNVQNCIVLDNQETERPLWMVDLGQERDITGLLLLTGQTFDNDTQVAEGASASSTPYMQNVKKLLVYVDNYGGRSQIDLPSNLCGFVSRLHNALLKSRLHVTCMRRMRGRYIYVEAKGGAVPWTKYFRAVLCEVMVYD